MKAFARVGLVVLMAISAVACSRVDPGHIGVRVSNFGDRGVQEEVVQPGKLIWNGPGYQLYEFPTFKQNYVYKDAEVMTFGTVEGLLVQAPVGISYRIRPDMAVKLFQDYRKGVEEITTIDMRNMVQNELVIAAGTRKIEAVYGEGKAELIQEVKTAVTEKMAKAGVQVDEIYWGGNLVLPGPVREAIDAKIAATQKAAQRQNEVAQAEAEAEKAVATAQGEADSKLILAKAEAEAIQIKGEALRNNPALVDLTVAESWDGTLPSQYIGGGKGEGVILQLLQK